MPSSRRPAGVDHIPEAGAERARAALRSAWERVRGGVLASVDPIEAGVTALREEGLDEATRAAAENAAHKLAGSAGMFGFHRATELARQLEELFSAECVRPPASEATALAGRQVAELRQELESAGPIPPAAAEDSRPLVLVVHRDPAFHDRLAAAPAAKAIRRARADGVDAARKLLAVAPADVVLLDMALADRDGLAFLAEVAATVPRVPVIVLTGAEGFADRVEATRAGAASFLPATLRPGRIIEAALGAAERRTHPAGRLLAVDDDAAMLAALEVLFQEHALKLTTLPDPLRFWEALEETAPDLLLLDLEMPGVNGLELCRLVRTDPRWQTLPVLVLTAHADVATLEKVFAAGADDYVTKPVVGPELLTRVTNRLERVRLYRQMAETDPLTGLANRRKFQADVRRLRAMASRYDQPLSFALLDLDRFKAVNDQHGHATGDAVLQRLAEVLGIAFRAEDVVARWGGEEIALAMYGMGRDDGVARVAAALEAFREEEFPTADGSRLRVTFSAGVAQFGQDGDDLHELYRQADAVLYDAKAAGGDRALPVGWRRGTDDRIIDVLVVEPDEQLARTLLLALTTRGHSSARLAAGPEVLAQLTGPSRLRPRVILLDADLPGMSGAEVLMRLTRSGSRDDARVILLTDRGADGEALAVENGAFDHVVKPFTVPVLMHRIRRALVDCPEQQ